MKKLFFMLGYITLFISAHCQSDTLSIPFVSYWSKGDFYKFKITKTTTQWRNEKLTRADTSSYLVNFEVIDSTETEYKIKWSYRANLQSTYKLPAELKEKFKKYENFNIIYTTSDVGVFKGVDNWKEIRDMMNEFFNEVWERNFREKNDNEKSKNIITQLKTIFTSKESIEQLVCKELQYFHFPFGIEYSVQDTVEYKDYHPNLFGGEPIQADARIFVKDYDLEIDRCILIQESELNPEHTKQIVFDLIKKVNAENKKAEEIIKNSIMKISDRSKYDFFFYPGIPINIESERFIRVKMGPNNGKKIEKIRIQLIAN